MNKEEEIKESIEFCNDIYVYYEQEEEEISFSYPKYDTNRKENTLSAIPAEEIKIVDTDDDRKISVKEINNEYHSYKKEFFHVLICIILAFLAAKLISSTVIQITTVHGDSMEATVSDGDKLFVGKMSYLFQDPERFDVIVFTKDERVNLIKRIIGLPGEKIEITEGTIYINGEALKEDYGLDPLNPEAEPVEMQLGEEEYFVLGDNRTVSLDSRYTSVGAVKKSEIIGKALVRIYPFSRMRSLSE